MTLRFISCLAVVPFMLACEGAKGATESGEDDVASDSSAPAPDISDPTPDAPNVQEPGTPIGDPDPAATPSPPTPGASSADAPGPSVPTSAPVPADGMDVPPSDVEPAEPGADEQRPDPALPEDGEPAPGAGAMPGQLPADVPPGDPADVPPDPDPVVPTEPACLEFSSPEEVGSYESADLNGPSGMVASRQNPGVLYAHLDTGGGAILYATTTDGAALGEYTLSDLEQEDWEDMAVGIGPGGGQFVYFGDFGDNAAGGGGGGASADPRDEVQIFRVVEPLVSVEQAFTEQTVEWEVLRFTYPDGAHNAETLLVDPQTGDLVIVTKATGTVAAYRAPGDSPADAVSELQLVATFDIGQGEEASAGDMSPSGDRVLLRTYNSLLIWERPRGASLADVFAESGTEIPSAEEARGEAVTFSADGSSWYSSGEDDNRLFRADEVCE